MKIVILMEKGEIEFTCKTARIADGFLQMTAPKEKGSNEDHKELFIATNLIRIMTVDF